MKTAFKILMILVVAGFLVWSFVGLDKKADNRVCQGVELIVEDSLSLGLISEDDINEVLKSNKMTFVGRKLTDINMGNVERTLSQSPYIDTVMCSINAGGSIILKVFPKVPALYVMPNRGTAYYLDRRGSDMPVGNLTGNLCVATGNITKEFARKRLSTIARCIQDSTFWRAQVQQIDVVDEHDIRLYTRFADHVILLGDARNLPDQLWRLRVFYTKGLSEIGWDKYESINVAYDGIVIGTTPDDGRRDFIPEFIPEAPTSVPAVPTDSAAAAQTAGQSAAATQSSSGTAPAASATPATNATPANTPSSNKPANAVPATKKQ